jgi:glutathione synthase/RimK-type ligase-like ATP-grasp enzyme
MKKKILLAISILFFVWFLIINANPDVSDNKLEIMNRIPEQYKPKTEIYSKKKFNYEYPFVLKPSILSGHSHGVELIKNKIQEFNYLQKRKKDETLIQEFVPYKNEIGIYYITPLKI